MPSRLFVVEFFLFWLLVVAFYVAAAVTFGWVLVKVFF